MYRGSGSGLDESSIISAFLSGISFHFALPPLGPRAGVARRWLAISVMMRFPLGPGSHLHTHTHAHTRMYLFHVWGGVLSLTHCSAERGLSDLI